jgi:DnaJ-domain-containing protein 1
MSIDQLREAYERAEKLSLKNQDILVKQILKTIEEMEAEEEWDALFKDSRSPKLLEKLLNEAHEEQSAGKTKEGGFGRD